ncbi:MAG: hypothetical protein QJR02_00495 [Sinobacteraceae bacterium]|nr:hypothetical protein [Nevskiaceae bacterium]
MKTPLLAIAAGCAALLVGACSGLGWIGQGFGQSVDPRERERIHAAVPVGISSDEAEAKLSGLGYGCTARQGNFVDESGNQRSAARFLACVAKPGRWSFACENRDEVVVVVKDGIVDEVDAVRGPNCDQPDTRAMPPNSAK